MKKKVKAFTLPVTGVVGAIVLGSAALSPIADAEENPFALKPLKAGYNLAQDDATGQPNPIEKPAEDTGKPHVPPDSTGQIPEEGTTKGEPAEEGEESDKGDKGGEGTCGGAL